VTVPVAVLASGGGTNLQALIDAGAEPSCPYRIAVVVSDRHRAGALDRARRHGIPTEVVLLRDHPDRDAFDREVVARTRAHGVEWVCLAGWMKQVGGAVLEAWPGRILNIHPSLLPAFPGLHAQQQAFDAGVRVAGCTVHLVDAGLDTGPIVIQAAVPVLATDDAEALRSRILAQEHAIYPEALRWAVQGQLRVEGRRVALADPAALTHRWSPPNGL
jgi:phosphoribosylglycinamide formyltransferase-1